MTLRRLKTYTGAQGYVYQYYFVGQREALVADPAAPASEYIFDVTSDRKTTFAVSILLPATFARSRALDPRRRLSGRTSWLLASGALPSAGYALSRLAV